MTERRLNAGEPMRGDYNPFVGGKSASVGDDSHADEEPVMHWTDGFPHDFRGWGPLAPDYRREQGAGRETRREEQEQEQERFRTRLRFDDEYLTWRARQFEWRNADYSAWQERSARTQDTEH